MKLRRIGSTYVSSIGLGGAAWSFTDMDTAAAIRVIHSALDMGVTLLDTARAYTRTDEPSHNENLIRRALNGHPLRDDILISTKGGHYRAGQSFPIDGRPAAIRAHCYDSLRNLGVDRIGLYFLHHPDPHVPLEDSMGTLADLQHEGAIGLIGVSNVTLDQLTRARTAADVVAVQNHFSPYDTTDRAMIEELHGQGIAYLAYSPLGGPGRLTADPQVLHDITTTAGRWRVSPQRIVLAWELAVAPNIIPIVGASQQATLADSIRAQSLQLTTYEIARIGRRPTSSPGRGPARASNEVNTDA